MANDRDMWMDVEDLHAELTTYQQGQDLSTLYFYKYISPNVNKLAHLKRVYVEKYGFLDNYV